VYYVTVRAGRSDLGGGNFARPAVGMIQKWSETISTIATSPRDPLAWATVLAMLGLMAQVALLLRHWRPADPAWRVGAAFTAFMLTLGPTVWEGSPGAALRVLVPLNLAANLVALRAHAAIGWLVACNLTVCAGVLAFRDVPRDGREVAMAMRAGAASVLQLGDSWTGWEFDAEQPWGSTRSPGRIIVRTWPPSADVSVLLNFALQSPKPSIVTIADGNDVVWRGPLAEGRKVPVVLPLTVAGGRLELDLTMESGPVSGRLDGAPDGRIGLAMFDPHLQLTSTVARPLR
jgi:hypothetical protein